MIAKKSHTQVNNSGIIGGETFRVGVRLEPPLRCAHPTRETGQGRGCIDILVGLLGSIIAMATTTKHFKLHRCYGKNSASDRCLLFQYGYFIRCVADMIERRQGKARWLQIW